MNLVAKASLRNYTYGTLGSGVDADSIVQMRNTYYYVKYWTNNSNIGQYEKKGYYMSQIENLYRDDDQKLAGFSTLYSKMFNSMDSLKGNAGDLYIRTQFINNAGSLTEYFNNMYHNLSTIQADCNQEVSALVTQINSFAQKRLIRLRFRAGARMNCATSVHICWISFQRSYRLKSKKPKL